MAPCLLWQPSTTTTIITTTISGPPLQLFQQTDNCCFTAQQNPSVFYYWKDWRLSYRLLFFQAILWGIEWTRSQMVLQQICNFSPRKVTVMSRGIARHTQATVSRLVQLPPLDLRATVMCGEAESCRSWDWKQTLSCGIMSHKVVVSSPQHPWTSEKYMSVTFDFKIYIPCVLKSKYGDVEASEAES